MKRFPPAPLLILAGCLLILAASGLYAIVPPGASLPVTGLPDWQLVRAETTEAARLLAQAGEIGVYGDFLLLFGAALRLNEPLAVPERLLWTGVVISTALFVGVDLLAAMVLPVANEASFPALRMVHSGLFVAGTGAFGFAVLALALGRQGWWRGVLLAYGLAATTAMVLWFRGFGAPQVFGILVTLGVAGLGVGEVRVLRRRAG